MNSFQNEDINNKMAVNLGTVYTHTVMFTKISASIERAIYYLAWNLSLKNINKLKEKNKYKAILKYEKTRENCIPCFFVF